MKTNTKGTLNPKLALGFGLSMFSVGAFFLLLSPALPNITRDLHTSPELLGLPSSLYGACLGASALITSVVLDGYDRRLFYFAGLAGHAFGIATIVTAQSWTVFALGWAICGLGAGILQPAAYAMVSDATTDGTRARALGRVNVGWAAATLIGVPVSAFLLDAVSWRFAMSLYLLLWSAVVILTGTYLARRPQTEFIHPEKPSLWSRARLDAILDLRLHWVFAATIFIFIGFYGVYSFLGVMATQELGLGAGAVGLFVSVYGGGFLIGTLNTSLIDRIGPRRALILSTGGLALILLMLPAALFSVTSLAIIMMVWGVFQVGAFTSLTSIAGGVSQSLRGLALALNASAVMIGASIGAGLMGIVLSVSSYQVVGAVCAASTALAMLIAVFRIQKRDAKAPNQP